MIFSSNNTIKKALFLAALVIFAFASSSALLVLAQERDNRIDLQEFLAPTRKFDKSSNHLKGGGTVPPIRGPNNNENHVSDGDRRQRRRRLDLSTAVNYPNPCLGLPANRVPDLNENNPANDGWTLAMGPNHNDGTPYLPLPFTFTLFGQSFSALSIANHGYIELRPDFLIYLDVFSSNVDTRGTDGTDGGYVWRKAIGTNKYAVAWDNVGYYDQDAEATKTDKLNTFQVLISDGTDASMGLGNNVCYCYQDIQWTVDGLGGVGVVDHVPGRFVQIGYFIVTDSTTYDGGYGNYDGFEYLDRKSICFKASGSNIPPIAVNVPENNHVDLACGESITNLVIFFLAPEENQGVTLTMSGASAGLTVDILEQSNQATATATINWTPTAAATVNVTLSASDGLETTTVNLTFTSPGPCCQGTTAEIWNPTTNKFVEALVNGSTYCLKKYNLRAVPCQTAPVVLKLWNTKTKIKVKRQKKRVPPYFLWGNKINATGSVDVKPNPKVLRNGNYALRIKAISNATSNANSTSSYTEIRFKQSCP